VITDRVVITPKGRVGRGVVRLNIDRNDDLLYRAFTSTGLRAGAVA